MTNMNVVLGVFLSLFTIFAILGFGASRWRKGNLNNLSEWALAGRRLGPYLAWFLVGGDLYTAYTFIAVPSAEYAKGSIYLFATPYVMTTFAIAVVAMASLWKMSRKNNYITGVDFVRDRFKSRWLAMLIAATGIIAELPYIALQIVGMKAVLEIIFVQYFSNYLFVSEIALLISFIVLSAFTFWSGLRGAALTAVMKDAIILISVVVVVIAVPLSIHGGFSTAFAKAKAESHMFTGVETLLPKLTNAYISLFILSALTLYFYPHAINGVLSAKNVRTVRLSSALLPMYGVGLFLLTLFGVLIFAVPDALNLVRTTGNGALVVPALLIYTMPPWFVGFALLGIFIGGLVPAAVMAISQSNLLVRNIIKEFKKDLKPETETRIVKWATVVFKFLALGFVFALGSSDTYAISLQLLGGVFIAQTLPAMLLGLYQKNLNKNGLLAGWFVGMIAGIYLMLQANHFAVLKTALGNTPFGLLYIAASSLAINLFVVYVWTYVARIVGHRPLPAGVKAGE